MMSDDVDAWAISHEAMGPRTHHGREAEEARSER